jgi:hypothetical protein
VGEKKVVLPCRFRLQKEAIFFDAEEKCEREIFAARRLATGFERLCAMPSAAAADRAVGIDGVGSLGSEGIAAGRTRAQTG